MKRMKRVLSLAAVLAMAASMLAVYLPTSADTGDTVAAPSFYGDNYQIVRDFTNEATDLPGNVYGGEYTWLVEDSGTPSPDGMAAKMYIGMWGQDAHSFYNLDFSAAADAEAITLWYSFPFTGINYMRFSVAGEDGVTKVVKPTILSYSAANDAVTSAETTEITYDNRTDVCAPLVEQGYVIITAEDLAQYGMTIQDVKQIVGYCHGIDPWVGNTSHWYVDDIGFVKDVDAFKAAVMADHDVSALEAAMAAAAGKDSADYTADSWAAYQAAVEAAGADAVVAELKGKSVFYKANTAPASIAQALAALEEAEALLVEATEPDPDPEPDPNAPPFYNDNYVVVNDYTDAGRLPTGWGSEPITTPALSTDSGTPSPDGSAAALPLNEAANNYFYIDNDFSAAPAEAEALVFWYSLPYTGEAETVPAGYYNPHIHVYTPVTVHYSVSVDMIRTNGTTYEGTAGYPQDFTLGTSGYVIIRAEDLTDDANPSETFPISEITRLALQSPSSVNAGNETLYIDDIGYVQDVDAFVASITAKHDVSALEAAAAEADTRIESNYTAETWAPFAAALADLKTVLNDLSGKTVLYKASTATADMARVLATLEEKEALLEEVDDPEPEPEPDLDVDPDSPYASMYDDNYVVLNDFTNEEDLPEGWGSGAMNSSVTTEVDSPSNHAAALPINDDGNNSYHVYADFSAAPEGAEGIAFWYSLSGDAELNGYYSAYINVYKEGGGLHAWTPLTFIRAGMPDKVNTTPAPQDFELNTMGYAFIDAQYLVDDSTGEAFSVSDIRTIDIQHSSTVAAQGATLYIDDLAAVMDKEAFLEKAGDILNPGGTDTDPDPDAPGGDLGQLYDDNYTIINDFTTAGQLPSGWGNGPLDSSLTTESGSPSPDGSAAALPLNDNANNSWYVRGNFASAAEGAEGLAFWYSLPYSRTDETGTGYYNVYVNITTSTGKTHNWTPLTFIRLGSETVGTAGTQDFVLNTWGYAIIDAKDLVDDATGEPFAISEIDNIAFQAAGTAQNTAGKTLYIDDLGVVTDLDAFKEKVKLLINPSYMVQPLPAGEDITLTAEAQGTFVDTAWNEMEGAYQYYVNLYTVDGETYTFVKTDTTRDLESTISGLTESTDYAVQVLALNTDEEIISASNVVAFTTLAEDVPEYMNGPLPYDETMTANGVNINGHNATVLWDWVSGVYSYKVYLYRMENDTPVFESEVEADFEDGSATFMNLDADTTYLAQVVAYDISESIIFAYTPLEFDLAGGSHSGGGEEEPTDPPTTGYAAPLAILMLSVGAAAVLVATRKRKG